MIHMLCRFDLQDDVTLPQFQGDYQQFVDRMKARNLIVGSDEVGQRLHGTPMDTDAPDAAEYYVIMRFCDRRQLDEAYDFIARGAANGELGAHNIVREAMAKSIFTCWADTQTPENEESH